MTFDDKSPDGQALVGNSRAHACKLLNAPRPTFSLYMSQTTPCSASNLYTGAVSKSLSNWQIPGCSSSRTFGRRSQLDDEGPAGRALAQSHG